MTDEEGQFLAQRFDDLLEFTWTSLIEVQSNGPYHLIGYSFGGLLACATADRLLSSGEKVDALILIDCYYDARYWPSSAWVKAQLRRSMYQLRRIVKKPPRKALTELTTRVSNFTRRIKVRLGSSPEAAPAPDAEPTDVAVHAATAYEPGIYPGRIHLIQTRKDRNFGCPPSEIWASRCSSLTVDRVNGDHLSLLRDNESLNEVARAIDRQLPGVAAVSKPTVMFVTTARWPSTAQLATAFSKSGFQIAGICPSGHPIEKSGHSRITRLPTINSHLAIRRSIEAIRPDLVIPCDECALALIAKSDGSHSQFERISSRAHVISVARANGVRAPLMQAVNSIAEVEEWIAQHGLPAVLKQDQSWGGLGVAIVQTVDEAITQFKRLQSPPGLVRSVKRGLVNGDFHPLKAWTANRQSTVNIQQYVEGRDANIAVACWHGEVLATIAMEVLEVSSPKGPATVMRIIDHPEMVNAAEVIVKNLNLSGLCGLDFVLDSSSHAHLLELNARATPTCHLSLGPQRNLIWALRKKFDGKVPAIPKAVTDNPIIAIYPSAKPDQIAKWNAWVDRPENEQ
jgi:thioesterase domain-containing protein